jgi:type I restriction enzyme S subunit
MSESINISNQLASSLPKGWQIKKLGDVCKLKNGYAFKSDKYENIGVPVIRISDINGGVVSSQKAVRVKANVEYENYLVENNDILVAMSGATTGKFGVYRSTEKAYQNQRVGKFKILNENILNNEFLFHQINSLKRQIEKDAYGGAQPNISSTKIEQMLIAIPPLPEQQAIVAKIEELLSELENGKQQLQIAQQQLKVYRQSLLNLLVTGKNPKTIESVIEKLDQGWSPKCLNENSKDENEWAVIKTSAVQHGHFVSFENKILPNDLKPREQHELKVGDILITRAGPRIRVGVCCMVRKTRPKLINCDKVYRIKVNFKIISPEYFELILNTPFYQREIEKMKSGISDSGLNLTQSKFLKIEIPIPTPEEQQLIVSELESKLTVCDKIEETISQSLQQAETLRQSILKKAFEGKLVTSNEFEHAL